MGGVFSSSSTTKTKPPGGTITATDRAILDLKNSRDRLNRFKKKLDDDEAKLLERAKICQKEGKKNMALSLMKLRKHKVAEATNVENQLLTILEMVDKIVGKQNENELVKAMKEGKEALEKLHKEMSVDDVLQLMDEIEEQSEVENQINDILTQGVGLSAADESAIEEELAALEQELMNENENNIDISSLPDVPTKELSDATVSTLPEVPTQALPEIEQNVSASKKQLVAS